MLHVETLDVLNEGVANVVGTIETIVAVWCSSAFDSFPKHIDLHGKMTNP